MSYPRSARARSRRDREFRRMVSRLNLGTPPSRISGDRDVLQAAIEHVQRQCDVADDLGPRGCEHLDTEDGRCLFCGDWVAPYDV